VGTEKRRNSRNIVSPCLNTILNPTRSKELIKSPMIQSIKKNIVKEQPTQQKIITNNTKFNELMNKDNNMGLKDKKKLLNMYGKKTDKMEAKPSKKIEIIEEEEEITNDVYLSKNRNKDPDLSKSKIEELHTSKPVSKNPCISKGECPFQSMKNTIIRKRLRLLTLNDIKKYNNSMHNFHNYLNQKGEETDQNKNEILVKNLEISRTLRKDYLEGDLRTTFKKFQGEDQDVQPAFKHKMKVQENNSLMKKL